MKKRNIIIVLIALIILSTLFYVVNKFTKNEIKTDESGKTVQDIKSDIGATGKDELYEVKQEANGRESITIKDEIKYKVELAGILKQNMPEYEELDNIIETKQLHAGIWISSESRENIFSLIQTYLKDNYKINEDGYLELVNKSTESNEYDEIIQKHINNNKIYIISATGEVYDIDNITGKIVLYPFEQMDEHQLCEPLEYEDKKIIVLTSNKKQKLSNNEIFEALINEIN